MLALVAVLFGLIGAYVVRKELLAKRVAPEAKKPADPADISLPVASASLPPGRKVTLGDIAILRVKPQDLQRMKISKAYMVNTQQIIGRVIKDELKKGDVFAPDSFYPEGTGPSVADKLKPGFRAVTISVEMDAGVAGFTHPGSMVDVLFRSIEDKASDSPEVTVPLIEGVEVLALNQETFQGSRSDDKNRPATKNSVTLAVRPEQASALRVVSGRGELALALRSPDDDEPITGVGPRTLDDLLERRRAKHKIDVYRGRSLTQVEFKNRDRLTPTAPPSIADVKPNFVPAEPPPRAPGGVTVPSPMPAPQ